MKKIFEIEYITKKGLKSVLESIDYWNCIATELPQPTEYCDNDSHYRGGSDKGINVCMDCGELIKPKPKIENIDLRSKEFELYMVADKLNEVIDYINKGGR